MRLVRLALPFLFLLAGCAGNLADHVGPRSDIISAQLIRYGLDLRQTRCVGERLGNSLTPLQLRRFERSARAVTRGYFDPDRLTLRDLIHVAGSQPDEQVAVQLDQAAVSCDAVPSAEDPPETEKEEAPVAEPAPAWLNLGAATTGQSIAINASTIEAGAESRRQAWFRLTDPDGGPSSDIFLLEVDCGAKTINAKERRRLGEGGAVLESREYTDNPLPVESGTVMEIAYLSLCT